jgi:uncharacterized cupredoxin-like copper-binding protein
MISRIAMHAAAAALLLACSSVHAHGEDAHGTPAPGTAAHGTAAHDTAGHHRGAHAATAFGHPGDRAKVSRTVNLAMSDDMRFAPSRLVVRRGETVRFVLRNDGKALHEMVLGTEADLRRHAEQMRAAPDMAHAEANMVHVAPGAQRQLVWTFAQPGEFAFACLIPGHYEAGMKGKVVVE